MTHIKHIWKGSGWQHHVISWGYQTDGMQKWVKRTCSEKNCEVNFEPVVKQPIERITVEWRESRGWTKGLNGSRHTTKAYIGGGR